MLKRIFGSSEVKSTATEVKTELTTRESTQGNILAKLDNGLMPEAIKFETNTRIIAKGLVAIQDGAEWEDYGIEKIKEDIKKIENEKLSSSLLTKLTDWEKNLEDANAYLQAKYQLEPQLKKEAKYKNRETDLTNIKESINQIRKKIEMLDSHLKTSQTTKRRNHRVLNDDDLQYTQLAAEAEQNRREIKPAAKQQEAVIRVALTESDRLKSTQMKVNEVRDILASNLESKMKEMDLEPETLQYIETETDDLEDLAHKRFYKKPKPEKSCWAKLFCCCGDKPESEQIANLEEPLMSQTMS